ncbi:MAG: hypothetical protein ACO218_07770 [Steroidobacteraceae bacterium]
MRIASAMAAQGLPLDMIADAIGVHRKTCHRWVREAEEQDADELKVRFRAAVFEAYRNTAAEMLGCVTKSANDGNTWAATWMLTHHPALRDQFSDAAADRRVERRTMSAVVDAIAAAGLPVEQERTVLLQLQARGLGGKTDADT